MDTYQFYDKVVSDSLQHILDRTKNEKALGLDKFYLNDKENLFIFSIAFIAAGISGKRLSLNCDLLTYLRFIFTHWNSRHIVKKGNGYPINIIVCNEMKHLYDKHQELYTMNGGLGEIYDAYYSRRKD